MALLVIDKYKNKGAPSFMTVNVGGISKKVFNSRRFFPIL